MAKKAKSDGVRAMTGGERKAIKAKAVSEVANEADGVIEVRRAARIEEFPELEDVLPDLAREYQEWHRKEGEAKANKQRLSPEINALLDAVECKSIAGADWIALYVEGAWQEKISAEKLLELGVTMDQIKEATIRKQNAGYVQVRKIEE